VSVSFPQDFTQRKTRQKGYPVPDQKVVIFPGSCTAFLHIGTAPGIATRTAVTYMWLLIPE